MNTEPSCPSVASAAALPADGVITPPQTSPLQNPRVSQPKNIILLSLYRPAVRADKRLRTWTSPHTSTLSDLRNHNFLDVALAALEPTTRKNYGAGLLRYTQFYGNMHVSESNRIPASELLLSQFIAAVGEGCGHWRNANGGSVRTFRD